MKEATVTTIADITVFTHQGRVREGNEDTIAVGDWVQEAPMAEPRQWHVPQPVSILVAVVDGMGGHAAGEIASRIVADRLSANAATISGDNDARTVLQAVNAHLFEQMASNRSHVGMGATVAGIVVVADRLIWFNVGDSRLYRYRNGFLRQISIDDVPLVGSGLPSEEPRRSHAITQALGGSSSFLPIEPHVGTIDLPVPSRWLLCTDGLTDMIAVDSIETCMAHSDDVAVKSLFDMAMKAGGEDNISIAVISILSERAEPSAREEIRDDAAHLAR